MEISAAFLKDFIEEMRRIASALEGIADRLDLISGETNDGRALIRTCDLARD